MPRKNKYQEDYITLKSTGMFWEFHPELSGEWEKDKEEFIAFSKRWEKVRRKNNK
jgi:hypothetical protein